MSRLAPYKVWALALACLDASQAAHAAVSDGAATYDVPLGCPGRGEWLEALRGRLPPLLRTHPLVESQSVHIERVESGYEGSLDPPGAKAASRMARSLHAATCEELIDVLSFMGALALERVLAAESASTSAEAAPSPAPSASAGFPNVGADRGAGVGSGGRATGWRAGATAFALWQSGIVPGQSLDIGVAGRLEWAARGWQPLVLVGLYSGPASEVVVEGAATVRFEHWSTHAIGCPWRFPNQGPLALRPCIDFDLGLTRAERLSVADGEERSAPWVSAGAQVRLELELWDHLQLGASVGATKPLYHARFFIRPGSTAFETPDFGLRAGSYASVIF